MRVCVFCRTRYQKGSEITFHKFPTDSTKLLWLKNMKMENWTPKSNDHLCSKHFTEDCFIKHISRTAINKGRVPTIFFGNTPVNDGIDNPTPCAYETAGVNRKLSRIDHENTNIDEPKPLADHGYTRKVHYDHTYSKEATLETNDALFPEVSVKTSTRSPLGASVQLTENEEPGLTEFEDTVEESFVDDDEMQCEDVADESVQMERPFSWQQPSAVVPCDADTLEEGYTESELIWGDLGVAGTLEVAGTAWDSGSPGLTQTPWQSGSPGHETAREAETHARYQCNACEQHIHGFRYLCVQCADFDLCGACEAAGRHRQHYVLRVPPDNTKDEVEAVLQTIRRAVTNCIVHLNEGKIEIKEETDQEDPIAVGLGVSYSQEPMDPPTENPTDSTIPHSEDPIAFCAEDRIEFHTEDPIAFYSEDPMAFYTGDPRVFHTEDLMVPELVPDVSNASHDVMHLSSSESEDNTSESYEKLSSYASGYKRKKKLTASIERTVSPKQAQSNPSNVILQLERDFSGAFRVTSQTTKALKTLQLKERDNSDTQVVAVPALGVTSNASDASLVTVLEQCINDMYVNTSSVSVVTVQAQCLNHSTGATKRCMAEIVTGMMSPERKKVTAVRLQRLTKEEIKAVLHKS